jgi:hypothetical protein
VTENGTLALPTLRGYPVRHPRAVQTPDSFQVRGASGLLARPQQPLRPRHHGPRPSWIQGVPSRPGMPRPSSGPDVFDRNHALPDMVGRRTHGLWLAVLATLWFAQAQAFAPDIGHLSAAVHAGHSRELSARPTQARESPRRADAPQTLSGDTAEGSVAHAPLLKRP